MHYMFPFDKVDRGSKIIIYGAGDIGKTYAEQVLAMDYCELLFVVDRNYAYLTFPKVFIHPPEKIFEHEYDKIIIASDYSVNEIANYLLKKGVPEEKIVKSVTTIELIMHASDFNMEYRKYPMKESNIFYEASQGAGMICNPYAIFKAFMDTKEFQEYQHIWSIAEEDELERLRHEYRDYPNVHFVLRDGEQYAYYLSTSKFLIQNTTFPLWFSKRKEQILVSTWHSITVKTLGFDCPNGVFTAGNVLRCFMQSDYIISANGFMTEVFLDDYKLRNLYPGSIIQEGHPRTDLTLNAKRENVINQLIDRGVRVDPRKKIILYAPTWKGKDADNVRNDFEEHLQVFNALNIAIDRDEYQLLVKVHNYTYRTFTDIQRSSSFLLPLNLETNELLSAVDILISDYSSIYFDYMPLDRAILFYIPDLEQYREERGILFDLEELPGPVTADIKELGEFIINIEEIKIKYQSIYQKTKNWACKHDDGKVGHKMIDIVFNNNHEKYNLIHCNSKVKKRLLFYPGSMKNNGVTEVFLTFLNMIDYEKYDVSVHCSKESKENIMRIPKEVRVFLRPGNNPLSFSEDGKMKHFLKNGFEEYENTAMLDEIFGRDFMRCFGCAVFDYVIDFAGYGLYYPALLSMAKGAKKYIWQHNDLLQDMDNKEKRTIRNMQSSINAKGLSTIYERYDKIISVGEPLMKVNRKNLSGEQTEGRFGFVNNPINIKRIEKCLLQENAIKVPESQKAAFKFVTMGRLSPEKNHKSLVKGFAKFCKTHSNSFLYIIGSDEYASYESEMRQLIDELGLKEKVILVGQTDNPFVLIKGCDCFILPSRYEGMCLVVHEVRCLGLPVILSNYSSVEGACIPNGQLIIGMSEEDICGGMLEFAKGNVPGDYQFDPYEYNRECFRQFLSLFE